MAHWRQACACWLIINEIIVPIRMKEPQKKIPRTKTQEPKKFQGPSTKNQEKIPRTKFQEPKKNIPKPKNQKRIPKRKYQNPRTPISAFHLDLVICDLGFMPWILLFGILTIVI